MKPESSRADPGLIDILGVHRASNIQRVEKYRRRVLCGKSMRFN
jgi:hypothetical protein